MHWFLKFLAIVFLVSLIGYNLSFAESAYVTLDVAGTIGYFVAVLTVVLAVLVAVVHAGLKRVVPGSGRVKRPAAVVVANPRPGARTKKVVTIVEQEDGRVGEEEEEEVIVDGGTPVVMVNDSRGGGGGVGRHKRTRPRLQTRAYVRARTRCACGAAGGDRCLCDLQKRANRSVTVSSTPFVPALPPAPLRPAPPVRQTEYSLVLTNEIAARPTLACTIEVASTCLDISVDAVYGSSNAIDHIRCRPTRIRINNVPKPTWFDLPYSDTNRDMSVRIREDANGIYIERASAEFVAVLS